MKAEFIAGPRGDLFALYLPPDPGSPDHGDLIFVPPFAEEMNRSRAVVLAHARAFNRAGLGILVLDLYGTGDSDGGFADARWETWREDIRAAGGWLRARGRDTIGLWGLRLGGLLALDTMFDDPLGFRQLVLWEPVTSGTAYMDQFLRIGVAEGMESGGRSITLDEMRLKLSRTEPVEVAGYVVSRILTHAIDRSDLLELIEAVRVPVTWIDCAQPTAQRLALIEDAGRACAANGALFDYVPVRTAPFWSVTNASAEPPFAEAVIGAVVSRHAAG
ncbi:hydrolase 2, exosortase A system-associated [Emcibacter sp. SYSU 3D8]|uniref:hydrolase 2, exosortase A system-associated n=1 Tax=Emcibacter sp. SYSU 3D8 TaxID=3133969 RepID=UPI0031FE4BEE